jgi:hypothetical protein
LQAAGLLVPAHGWLALSDSGRKLFASVGGLSAPPMSQLIATGAALQSVTLPLADAAPFTLPRALFEYCVRAQVRTGA